MTRRRRFVFAIMAMLLSSVVAAGLLLAGDLYLHHRAERSAGLNRWGYRGPVVGRKQPGELRVAVLGGSTVFGYGVFWEQAIPALLERELRGRGRQVSVINLGYNNEGAFALRPTLEDFAYLDFDIVCLYAGYNDWWGDTGRNTAVFRHNSPVFRMTGYFPILPLMAEEKAEAIRTGGQIAASPQQPSKTVFTPGLVDRSSAAALDAVSVIGTALGRQLDRIVAAGASTPAAGSETGCTAPWVTFCDSVYRAVSYSLEQGKKVIVVGQPLMTEDRAARHADQQRATREMLDRKFPGDARVRWVDLSRAVDLADRDLSFDTMHLGVLGNEVVARALAGPVLDLSPANR